LNEQLAYGFDRAGNLNYRTNNALIQNFAVNSDNELTMATNGGTLTVVGTTTSQATNVTVNGTNALRYGDATFAATNMPLTTTYTAVASDSYGRRATNTVSVNLSTNITFQYDANGNLTNDGLRSFAYDDENQLIQVWVPNQWFSQFTYDGKMRRRIRQEFTWQGSGWVQTNAVYYVYDGNLVIQERDINNLPTTTHTRGKDLSGSLEGAGGIGGLLARTGPNGSTCYHADGNGNITMLINWQQAIVAKYLYDAFGNVLSASGLLADANLYQFSSKEKHQNSGLVYYLYRYYDPNLQRWVNRDPFRETGFEVAISQSQTQSGRIGLVAERGNPNLFAFLHNRPVNDLDAFGLCGCTCGGDVTREVYQTLQDILDTYNSASWYNQFMGKLAMFGFNSVYSWDIKYLYNYTAPIALQGCKPCDQTVTFQGMCVRAHDLNYIMYGWGTTVTLYPANTAMVYLILGLEMRLIDGQDSVLRKLYFAEFGAGLRSQLPNDVVQPDCAPQSKVQNVDIHDWHWQAIKE
jgi:RHS repeat-associated protein